MTLDQRQTAVLVLFTLAIAVRAIAHRQAGGITRDQSDGVQREGGTVVAVLARLVFSVGGTALLAAWLIAPDAVPGTIGLPSWLYWLGLVLAEAGVALLAWVHLALGVHFSGTLHLRDDHRLVQTGPYTRVRHPMYSAFLLLFMGLSLLTANGAVAAVWLGSQAWVLAWRLRAEEAQLAERFGVRWQHYRSRTGALVPRLR